MQKMLMHNNRYVRWTYDEETGEHTIDLVKETPNLDPNATTNLITEENNIIMVDEKNIKVNIGLTNVLDELGLSLPTSSDLDSEENADA